MTDENNQIFAKFIRNKLDEVPTTLNLQDFLTPTKADIKKYFPKLQ
jgi:hypothetical protein